MWGPSGQTWPLGTWEPRCCPLDGSGRWGAGLEVWHCEAREWWSSRDLLPWLMAWDRADACGWAAVMGSCWCALTLSFQGSTGGSWIESEAQAAQWAGPSPRGELFQCLQRCGQAGWPQAFTVRQHNKWGLTCWPRRPAEDAPNGSRHPGGSDNQLLTGTAWLPDSQANSPCISETKRHVVGTVQGMVGVGMEGLRETKERRGKVLS